MSENENECTHDCSTCSANCPSKDGGIPKEALNPESHVNHVIGVVSGKGGVGKSLVTSLLATIMCRKGNRTAVLDADVTGPSIPKIFGAKGDIKSDGKYLLPYVTKSGIQMISVNFLLEDETSPVVWRGPVIAGAVKQFWTDVTWNNVNYMFVDMPPGTGDVPLTVFQSLPVEGIVIVTTPQDLVSMIVEKAVKMAGMMNIPVIGIVENMSSVICPDCGKRINVFGDSHIRDYADANKVPVIGEIPLDARLAELCDKGMIEQVENAYLESAADAIKAFAE